jgi:SPP1 gp7 family putative phage head morphogenesis protein
MYDPALAHSLKYNVAQFSAFKETSFRKQLEASLTKNGEVVPWSEFKKTAAELNVVYNSRWLKTEYHHTVATANMAEKWKDFEADKDLYPNLKYVTVGDNRVRDEHKAWNGLILPINHPFWKTHTTPNDWGCRCDIVQTDEDVSVVIPDLKIKTAFQNNAALSGKIFNEIPYENGLSVEERKEVNTNVSEFSANEKTFINTKNPKVKISLGADLQDLKRNYQIADIASSQLDMDFLIRTHVDIKGIKNPEYLILNKYLGDRKSIEGIKGVIWNIDNAKKQMWHKSINPTKTPYYIVFDLDLIEVLDLDDLKKVLNRKITADRGTSVKGLIFQYKGKAVHLTREQIVNREYLTLDILK